MDAIEYLKTAREAYVDFYRRAIREHRDGGDGCLVEVWVRPNPAPGSDEIPKPLCVDLIQGPQGERAMVSVFSGPADAGGLVGTIDLGPIAARVFPIHWDVFGIWVRHGSPDWAILDDWRRKWMDADHPPHDPDEDGLHAGVHYLEGPSPEGGGWVFEADFGSAPVEALIELLKLLASGGAEAIELGQSDGSDLDPELVKALQRPDLSREALSEILVTMLNRLPEVQSARAVGPEQIEVNRPNRSEGYNIYTTNLFLRLQRTGVEARALEVCRFVRGQRESMHDAGAPDLAQLRPVIKDDRFFAEMARATNKSFKLVARRLVGDLSICCVWDQPHGMRFTVNAEPEKYGMTANQMLDRAIANYLEDHAAPELVDQGTFQLARTGDNYDASLLLDDAFWSKRMENVKGKLLVCVPSRDAVLIADSAEHGAIRSLAHAVNRITSGGDHLISETILSREDDSWEVYASARGGVPVAPAAPAARDEVVRSAPRPESTRKSADKPWWKFW